MRLSPEQIDFLKRPLAGIRVASRSGGNNKRLSYLEAWDVRAHLNRAFGFTNFDVITRESTIEYAAFFKENNPYWLVGCRALVEVRIRNEEGEELARYSDVAFAQAKNSDRGEATDQALKSAVSDALKRACTNLGDQFGLSLYNDGSLRPVVGHLVPEEYILPDPVSPEETPEPDTDVDATLATEAEVAEALEADPRALDGDYGTAATAKEEAQGWR